jgi:hypothetical protein
MECTSGVRTAPTGAGWIWDTLADSASSHHIPSLAPAVALPAPRHDRRRTGAAGSPPGGFPFVELTSRGCEMCGGGARRVAECLSFYRRRTNSVHSRPRLREGKLQRESTTSCPGRAKRRPGTSRPDLRPWVPAAGCASRGRTEERMSGHTGQIETRPRGLCWTVGTCFATGRSPCGAHRGGISGA